ncbi:FecR domain-containing protein [Luteolibacter flavescens]|uniref:FecR domain-containing protein n=1 Tax=Luteolibacter flavescens TaxID=1859460 RepID=A0ABT3FNL9_9BACT|nr:LamG-like jellyroll fold domain-containing protein [Luteolibacter flavescens]MCW1884841.1 FecR domain-containing protein [Luteolibacter flavescens]
MFDEARLDRLISAHFDRELTEEERRELEAMLLSSSKARQLFLEHSEWHGLLREQALQAGGASLLEDTAPSPPARKVIPFSRRAWISAGLAACLALGWWLVPSKEQPGTGTDIASKADSHSHEVALLDQAFDVEWDSTAYAPGEALPKGFIKIRKGTLQLDFYSGARVVLEGPATLELLSPNLARLDNGKLTAKVPPPAEGFTVINAKMRVVDRGTEFGMSVTNADDCEVHVFDGEVELQGEVPEATARELFEGHAVSIRHGKSEAFPASREAFTDPSRLMQETARVNEAQRGDWQTASQAFSTTPDLQIHFDFEGLDRTSMILTNRAAGAAGNSHGTIIGCETLSGRWDRKGALGFAKTSDRVRFRAEGVTPSVTLMAWVRVDSLPLEHNALLSMAPEQIGEIHWKLDRDGRMLLGLRAEPEHAYPSWERLESPPVVTPQDFGRWLHLATVIDGDTGMMRHYMNGSEVAAGSMTRKVPIQLGLANLGNFDASSPTSPTNGMVRNFNGRIDEFALLTRALTAEEIAAAMR